MAHQKRLNFRRKKLSARKRSDYIAGYLFIAPVTLGLLVFYIYPFFQNLWFSFNSVNKFNQVKFVGLRNYIELCSDTEVLASFMNTLTYVVVSVPLGICIALFLASLLNANIRGKSLYRTLYFLPSVTMAAAVSLVWRWIYNDRMGILNSALRAIGLEGHNWLTDPNTALFMVVIVGLWMGVGYQTIILLAGMQGIPKTYYEAAAIDGASPFSRFFRITIPLLTPTIFFVLITSIIGGFQVFDTIYMMISPNNPALGSAQTVSMMFFRHAFEFGHKGYAAAISICMFAVIMLVTVSQMLIQKKWVHYE